MDGHCLGMAAADGGNDALPVQVVHQHIDSVAHGIAEQRRWRQHMPVGLRSEYRARPAKPETRCAQREVMMLGCDTVPELHKSYD